MDSFLRILKLLGYLGVAFQLVQSLLGKFFRNTESLSGSCSDLSADEASYAVLSEEIGEEPSTSGTRESGGVE